MINDVSTLKARFRDRRRALWHAYGPDYCYIPIHRDELPLVRASLRLMFGVPHKVSSSGSAIWDRANIVLTDYPYQIRTNGGTNPKIMTDLFAMIQAWEEST
jgi:hypothetical protein